MYFRYRKLEIICTNNTVYTCVWPSIGASYNHLLHEYNLIQCSSRCASKRNNITTQSCYKWTYLLLGAEHTITVNCNHKNLTYYRNPQHLTARQARWWNNLSRYNLQLIHTPGAKLIQADALSRRADHITGEEDNKNVTMLPDNLFINLVAEDLREQVKIEETRLNSSHRIASRMPSSA